MKSQILYEKDFVEKLKTTGGIKLLVLTGFFVNDYDKGIDLLLVGKINKKEFDRVIKELEEDLGRDVNYTLMNHQEFKYRRDITDMFLYNILEGKKMTVVDEYGI